MPFRKAEAVTRAIRECCDHLAVIDNTVRHDAGITPAMRTVLGILHQLGPQTVPQIARSRQVSRQHIQTLADKLLTAQLIAAETNHRDRRSPLFRLSERGEALVERLREKEVGIYTEMGEVLGRCDLEVTLETLKTLKDYLHSKSSNDAYRRQ